MFGAELYLVTSRNDRSSWWGMGTCPPLKRITRVLFSFFVFFLYRLYINITNDTYFTSLIWLRTWLPMRCLAQLDRAARTVKALAQSSQHVLRFGRLRGRRMVDQYKEESSLGKFLLFLVGSLRDDLPRQSLLTRWYVKAIIHALLYGVSSYYGRLAGGSTRDDLPRQSSIKQ